jgi:hypothetical protein
MCDELTLSVVVGVAATRQWRVDVLKQAVSEGEAELADIRQRNKELSRRVGRKQEV